MRIQRRWRRRIRLTAALIVCALVLIPLGLVLTRGPDETTSVAAPPLATDATSETSAATGSDITAPQITAPTMVSAISTDGNSVVVEFETTALDARDGELAPICLPRSGSLFRVGATAVTCIATDSAENVAVARLEVVVAQADPAAAPAEGPTETDSETAPAASAPAPTPTDDNALTNAVATQPGLSTERTLAAAGACISFAVVLIVAHRQRRRVRPHASAGSALAAMD